MAQRLSVDEAAATYVAAMRNPLPAQPGACATCRAFVEPWNEECSQCEQCVAPSLDVVVPITYSLALGQMHLALRRYKDGAPQERAFMSPRIAAILWKFLETHEPCVAAAARCSHFDVVTTVPSRSRQRDEISRFRMLVSWCGPVKDRLERLLLPGNEGSPAHTLDANRFVGMRRLEGEDVLLIDDTWTTGSNAQSAALTLKRLGARRVGLVVVGRHVNPEWRPEFPNGKTCGELYDELPRRFDWGTCAVHRRIAA